MADIEQTVQVNVAAKSSGEEVYNKHEDGIRRVSEAARAGMTSVRNFRTETYKYRLTLMAANSVMSTANMLISMAGVKSEEWRKVMLALNAVMMVGNTLLTIRTLLEWRNAQATWASAIANIAKHGILAPVVAGIVAAGVLGAMATMRSSMRGTKTEKMAEGGEGVVTKPTLFLAGEAGPERYSFTPLSKEREASKQVNIDKVTINVVAWSPMVAGAMVAKEIRRLKEAGK